MLKWHGLQLSESEGRGGRGAKCEAAAFRAASAKLEATLVAASWHTGAAHMGHAEKERTRNWAADVHVNVRGARASFR